MVIELSVLEELVEVYLLNNEEASSAYNRTTKEVGVVSGSEAVGDIIIIPQISSEEAYKLMVNFAKEQSGEVAKQLLAMLQEKKPFNKFKTQLHELELGDEWYEYENNYAEQVMTNWLEENK